MLDPAHLRARVLDTLRGREPLAGLWAALERRPRLTCFAAGGIVRDMLLDDPPRDVDLFIDGDEVAAFLDALDRQGELRRGPFGSPRFRPRPGAGYVDIIPIRTFHNGLWPCTDMKDVLNQFDFTCNAVAVDLHADVILDPQNGIRDARARVLRAVRFDYPDEPIAAGGPLSRPGVVWFRLLHYAASKRLDIEPVTLRWLHDNRHHLAQRTTFEETFFALHDDALAPLGDGRP
jgi:hypothetical protein